MKKLLLLGVAMFCTVAVANAQIRGGWGRRIIETNASGMKVAHPNGQVLNLMQKKVALQTGDAEVGTISTEQVGDDTIRFGIGGASMDIKPDPNDPNTVLFMDPNGNVVRKITKTVDANGNEVVQVKDAAGKVMSEARQNGDKASGFIREAFPNDQLLEMKVENGDVVEKKARLTGKKYKKDMSVGKNGLEIIVKDASSNKELYKMEGNDNYSRIYDAKGKLIAEGADEKNQKVYDKKAFEEFKRIMEEDDD